MELYPLLDLSRDALFGRAVGWGEGGVVAEGAAAAADGAVAIGTGEARVYGHLLHAVAEDATEIRGIAVESAFVAPRVDHPLVVFGS